MIKTVELIVIVALLIFSFFLGVKYSDSVKGRLSWLQTQDEQEVELPDLSNEPTETAPVVNSSETPQDATTMPENVQSPVVEGAVNNAPSDVATPEVKATPEKKTKN